MSSEKRKIKINFKSTKFKAVLVIAVAVVVISTIAGVSASGSVTPGIRLVNMNDTWNYARVTGANTQNAPFLSVGNFGNSIHTVRVSWNVSKSFWGHADAVMLISFPVTRPDDPSIGSNETKVEKFLTASFGSLYTIDGKSKIFWGNMTVSPGGWQWLQTGKGLTWLKIETDNMYNGSVAFKFENHWWLILLLHGGYTSIAAQAVLDGNITMNPPRTIILN